MGYIFCMMGKSSSGKDTIFQKLMTEQNLPLRKIIPYTTRPIRAGEVPGETYYFCSEEKVQELEAEGKIIELRAYDTIYGIWKYFTANDDQIHLDKESYLLIGTLETFVKIREYFGREKVIPIYIEVEDGERLLRAISREKQQKTPQYEEMCRRFLADQADFSEEKLEQAGVALRFENRSLEKTVEEIAAYIKKFLL